LVLALVSNIVALAYTFDTWQSLGAVVLVSATD